MIKTVTDLEMETILNQSLHIKKCPECGFPGSITLELLAFGANGVKVSCSNPACGYETRLESIKDLYETPTRFATPLTYMSLAKGLFAAVEAWNKQQTERSSHL